MLKFFGIITKTIQMLENKDTCELISEDEIHLDEDHPPPEALNYDISKVKPFLSSAAWMKVENSGIRCLCICSSNMTVP